MSKVVKEKIPDNAVHTCPEELPDGLIDWIRTEIFPNDNYVIYKKGNVRGTCALCRYKITPKDGVRMTQSTFIYCPNCDQKVYCILSGSSLFKADYVRNIAAIQKGADGTVWFRQWHILRDESAEYAEGIEKYLQEIARYAVCGRNTGMWLREAKESYYMQYIRYATSDWSRSRKTHTYDGEYDFYHAGIREAVKGTVLEYADLSGYMKYKTLYHKNIIKYALDFARYPVLEFFWKHGYRRIIEQKVCGIERHCANSVLWKRSTLAECIRFPLRLLKVLPPHEWDMAKITRMWKASQIGKPDKDILALFHSDIYEDNFIAMAKYSTVAKTMTYLEKQRTTFRERSSLETIASITRTYRDYISECEQLNLDLTKKEILFPKNLDAAHQRTMRMIKYEESREAKKKLRDRAEKLQKLSWNNQIYMIRPAENSADLKKEGAALKHCVAGYADRMTKGETAIFFIRTVAAPETPFFTLELIKNQVVQCRTKNNKSYDGDVKTFVESWIREVVSKSGRINKPEKARSEVI